MNIKSPASIILLIILLVTSFYLAKAMSSHLHPKEIDLRRGEYKENLQNSDSLRIESMYESGNVNKIKSNDDISKYTDKINHITNKSYKKVYLSNHRLITYELDFEYLNSSTLNGNSDHVVFTEINY